MTRLHDAVDRQVKQLQLYAHRPVGTRDQHLLGKHTSGGLAITSKLPSRSGHDLCCALLSPCRETGVQGVCRYQANAQRGAMPFAYRLCRSFDG